MLQSHAVRAAPVPPPHWPDRSCVPAPTLPPAQVPYEGGWVKLRGFPRQVTKGEIIEFMQVRLMLSQHLTCCGQPCCSCCLAARLAPCTVARVRLQSACRPGCSPPPRTRTRLPPFPSLASSQTCGTLTEDDVKLVLSADGTPLGEAFLHFHTSDAKAGAGREGRGGEGAPSHRA